MYKGILGIGVCVSLWIVAPLCFTASAQTLRRGPAIVQAVDESRLVSLEGNVRREASAANDRGAVDDRLPLDHLFLELKRPPEMQAATEKFLESQQDPQSPDYHKWITPAEFGERFGITDQDIGTVTRWLVSHGFVVNSVHPSRMLIDFSGTAGAVRNAFRTEIHNLQVNGARHIANMSDPQIPAALSPVVQGVASLHDFMPHGMSVPRTRYTFTSGGKTKEALVPGDIATIYNFNPAYTAGYTGVGQTIVVIEDSDVYSVNDFNSFRSTFGLATQYPSGSMTQVHPSGGTSNCVDPGATGDDAEAEIDVEWASAAAPNATIELASCASSSTLFGGFIALYYLLVSSHPPSIVSISYGESEALNGASGNALINRLYEASAAAGISIFVSSGDEGAASSNADQTTATDGITVSAFASTPYNVAVGGTDFYDTYSRQTSQYWSSTNGTYFNSALSYIPEIPWNDSCASQLIANALGYTTTYGSGGLCASVVALLDGLRTTASGSGGPSNCATGTPAKAGVAGGTCQGYVKPTWQQNFYGVNSPNENDGVRDIPDVALFAANGLWGHYYVVCYTDTRSGRGGLPCTGVPSSWAGFGGTSISSPIMAGIQALINQKMGAAQGNPNPNLYKLAQMGYGSVFNDVTVGDIDVNCTAGSPNCFDPGSVRNGGVLSTSTSSSQPAYATGVGWDFATGIGSVNAYQLVINWP
jgi:subtilase family serine protease